jgi:hypothetical protein
MTDSAPTPLSSDCMLRQIQYPKRRLPVCLKDAPTSSTAGQGYLFFFFFFLNKDTQKLLFSQKAAKVFVRFLLDKKRRKNNITELQRRAYTRHHSDPRASHPTLSKVALYLCASRYCETKPNALAYSAAYLRASQFSHLQSVQEDRDKPIIVGLGYGPNFLKPRS